MPSNSKGPSKVTAAQKKEARKMLDALVTRREANINRDPLGTRKEHNTEYGPFGVSKGRGGQPYVTTRRDDYAGETIGKGRYTNLKMSVKDLKEVTRKHPGKPPKKARRDRRKAALRGIVLRAENSLQRTPGADKLLRASIRRAERHGLGYNEIFTGEAPLFAMAKKGEAQAYNEFREGSDNLTEAQMDVFEYMSQSSDGSDVET